MVRVWTRSLGWTHMVGGWILGVRFWTLGVRFWTLGLGLDSEIVDGIQGSWVELG